MSSPPINIDELTIPLVHAAYKSNTYSAHQLTTAYLARITTPNPTLNAILAISPVALLEASNLDHHLSTTAELIGPLHGIPIIVKDQCDTAGIETTYGNILCKHIPTTDATLVTNLRKAGAIILAKSTMPDFAASYNSCSSVSGVTLNPYDITRETGGSSAGTGAAITANMGLVGIGEDTGGSIRVPSSFCNLVGLRPTVGLVSGKGLSPLVKLQDTPGPMCRTVTDAALLFDVLTGFDEGEITDSPMKGSYASNLTNKTLAGARIGVLDEVFGNESNPECASVNSIVHHALSKISSTGTTLIPITIPTLHHFLSYTSIYLSTSRHDIDSFLSSHPHLSHLSTAHIHTTKSFHPSLPLFNRLATGISDPWDDPEYGKRLDTQAEFQRLVIGIMTQNNLDAIAYPSVQIPPPLVNDVLGDRFTDRFPTNTTVGSQLRWPAISVPVGWTEGEKELPVGLEVLGVPYSEQKLLGLAYGVEELMGARRKPVFN